MTNTLDPKGLASARAAYEAAIPDGIWCRDGGKTDAPIHAAITAYLTATTPADVAALVERLREPFSHPVVEEMHLRSEAASALEALASRSPNETLERAAKKLEEMKRLLMLQTVVLDVARECDIYDIAAAAIRSMKEPE